MFSCCPGVEGTGRPLETRVCESRQRRATGSDDQSQEVKVTTRIMRSEPPAVAGGPNAMRFFRMFIVLVGVTYLIVQARPLPQAVLTVYSQNQNPLTERAYQDREILYELQSPESHAFCITHDYTVRKVGEEYYFNVERAGSHVT